MHPRAAQLVTELELAPHPEGGFFREIHRASALVHPLDGRSARSALTTIYFLLTAGQVSRWHRVTSDEVWHHCEGAVLELFTAGPDFREMDRLLLGPHDAGASPVHIVPSNLWQAARSAGEYTLVGCTVGPGFEFADFEMLDQFPALKETVRNRGGDAALFI